eukprot:scaffold77516_cov36-Cyclotella_meneghiniana.AAC.1
MSFHFGCCDGILLWTVGGILLTRFAIVAVCGEVAFGGRGGGRTFFAGGCALLNRDGGREWKTVIGVCAGSAARCDGCTWRRSFPAASASVRSRWSIASVGSIGGVRGKVKDRVVFVFVVDMATCAGLIFNKYAVGGRRPASFEYQQHHHTHSSSAIGLSHDQVKTSGDTTSLLTLALAGSRSPLLVCQHSTSSRLKIIHLPATS